MFDFSELTDHYPAIFEQMAETFTSHEFILKLAQAYQREYIEALYHYRDSSSSGGAPFRVVHSQLARHLHNFPELIEMLRNDAPSRDIFGNQQTASEWRKIGS